MAEEKPKIVAFDFDGVIGDSVYECYVQSIKALKDMGGALKESKEVEAGFRKARPFVKVAEDYLVVLKMIGENPKTDFDQLTQGGFESAKAKYSKDFAKFKERFLANRKEMQAKDEGGWFKLQKDFPGIVKSANGLIDRGYRVVIATTKDKPSVVKLLKQYNCKIKDEDIISKEIFEDKAKQLKFISLKYDVPAKEIAFVDDMVEQVKIAKKTGAKVAMADWGYSTQSQKEEATAQGIPLIRQEKLSEDLNHFIEPKYQLLTAVLIIILLLIALDYLRIISIFG